MGLKMRENAKDNLEEHIIDIGEIKQISQTIVEQLFLNMQKDVKKDQIGIIIDDTDLDVKRCNKIYGNSNNIIYCLGISQTTPKELEEKIRKYDTKDDWSNYMSSRFISSLCENIINTSKENKEKCKNFKNIKYVDTSQNREEVLDQIIKDLEKQGLGDEA